MDKIKAIKKGRLDLTDYLIHFTKTNGELTAFDTLKSIIMDGYIKTGWSVRNGKRTIFGKFPAICFSETPLYGFVDYVKKRRDSKAVDCYGIALRKNDLFKYGARNVIYGMTSYKKEEKNLDGSWYLQDFPEEEQYRYMLTDIDNKNDWTHEREWRWINYRELSDKDCLPIWNMDNINFKFSPIIIIVKSIIQKEIILNCFNNILNNLKINPVEFHNFQISNIDSTCIIVLNEIDTITHPHFKIESLVENKSVIWIGDIIKGIRPNF